MSPLIQESSTYQIVRRPPWQELTSDFRDVYHNALLTPHLAHLCRFV